MDFEHLKRKSRGAVSRPENLSGLKDGELLKLAARLRENAVHVVKDIQRAPWNRAILMGAGSVPDGSGHKGEATEAIENLEACLAEVERRKLEFPFEASGLRGLVAKRVHDSLHESGVCPRSPAPKKSRLLEFPKPKNPPRRF